MRLMLIVVDARLERAGWARHIVHTPRLGSVGHTGWTLVTILMVVLLTLLHFHNRQQALQSYSNTKKRSTHFESPRHPSQAYPYSPFKHPNVRTSICQALLKLSTLIPRKVIAVKPPVPYSHSLSGSTNLRSVVLLLSLECINDPRGVGVGFGVVAVSGDIVAVVVVVVAGVHSVVVVVVTVVVGVRVGMIVIAVVVAVACVVFVVIPRPITITASVLASALNFLQRDISIQPLGSTRFLVLLLVSGWLQSRLLLTLLGLLLLTMQNCKASPSAHSRAQVQ